MLLSLLPSLLLVLPFATALTIQPNQPPPISEYALNTTFPLTSKAYCTNPHYHRPLLSLRDCNAVLELFRSTPHFSALRTWSLDDEQAVRTLIAQRWTTGSCTIALTAESPDSRDVFQTSLVVSLAHTVIEMCVDKGTHDGGRIKIGPKQVFEVRVARKESFPPESRS